MTEAALRAGIEEIQRLQAKVEVLERLIEPMDGIVHFSDAVAFRDDHLSKALRGWIEAGRTALAQARKPR